MRLDVSSLGRLGDEVAVPAYDRSRSTVGIVHIGVGGFHRSHQAMYLDRLMNDGLAHDWAVCGVGLMPGDARMRDVLRDQSGLYTLMLKSAGERCVRVIGSVAEYLFAPDDPGAVVERMTDPGVRIVSMTLTEGGYNVHPATGEFDADNPDVRDDVANPGAPRTAFGLVVEALRRRRERAVPPFAVMSCDNVQSNGDVAANAVSSFADLVDPGLGGWIRAHVAFPNSMVDRITPVTTDADREEVRTRFGIDDGWPVVAEPFTQWALEDRFPLGRPPFERAGVQLVDDVEPYELMKLRLLNATHQGMCYFGTLAGYRYAHEATADPAIERLLRTYMDTEATPTLQQLPGVDLDAYKGTLIERYLNRDIADTLARLCAESSDRIPTWLVPVIRERLAAGGEVWRSAAVVASWARYAEGVDEAGREYEVVDQLADRLVPLARTQRENPTAFIEDERLFGDLAQDDRFVRPYVETLTMLHQRGARATLDQLAARSG
ncbi:mannitol 2-dehydrogenase [Haloactinopolyspora alba]|uniref:Mannitol-1-phosphate 5-dehydrogenase n=1 Tax=Haloactinopolyspora alba TaxID=648780 RepID=A0A2P8EC57_9ACTN|nr:mannitol dehydrogenase family protein [Haloactinopolyspora alba]PSL07044.1 mannitol 2-dehydrogenase [Haloactinopolyspora alba]